MLADHGGLAIVGMATEASHGTRIPLAVLTAASVFMREGVPCKVFLVHFRQDDVDENARRIDTLVQRIAAAGYQRVLLEHDWAPEVSRKLEAAGLVAEKIRAPKTNEGDTLPAEGIAVEVIGFDERTQIENVDLFVGQSCSYQRPVAGDGVYAASTTAHRGCSHCEGATGKRPFEADLVALILGAVARYRAALPDLRTLWIPFSETLFTPLRDALDRSRETPLFHGIDLAIQLRPDVLLRETPTVEAVAASALAAGTRLRLALVGFESFSPRDLDLLHRGVTPDQLHRAAEQLHDWRANPRPGLDVRRCTPSFILFNPWTTLADIELNLREIREHRLTNGNIERLRISPVMPLHELLIQSGLVATAPPRLEVHPNGYTDEVAYRFADAQVQVVNEGFSQLKPMALEAQPMLLDAVVRAVRQTDDPSTIDWTVVAAAYQRLGEACSALPRGNAAQTTVDVPAIHGLLTSMGTDPGFPARRAHSVTPRAVSGERARFVASDRCNNGCSPCVFERRIDADSALTLPIESDVLGRDVMLAGREPTMRDDLPDVIRAIKAAGAARVSIETNGRRLAYPSYARSLAAAGLDAIVVRLFGADAATWDAHTQVSGSFAQTMSGLAIVSLATPAVALSAVAYPRFDAGATLRELASFANSIGMPATRFVLRVENQDLLTLDRLASEVRELKGSVSVSTR